MAVRTGRITHAVRVCTSSPPGTCRTRQLHQAMPDTDLAATCAALAYARELSQHETHAPHARSLDGLLLHTEHTNKGAHARPALTLSTCATMMSMYFLSGSCRRIWRSLAATMATTVSSSAVLFITFSANLPALGQHTRVHARPGKSRRRVDALFTSIVARGYSIQVA